MRRYAANEYAAECEDRDVSDSQADTASSLRRIDGRAAALVAAGRIAGYMLALVDESRTHVLLDFALAPSGAEGWTRTDFVAPAVDFIERICGGCLSFNGVDYELRWLDEEDTALAVEHYDLTTWRRGQS